MLFADDERIEQDRGRCDRVNRRIHALGGHLARQHDHAVDMRGNRRHRGVGEVVGRHINRLDRRHRHAADRNDALLQSRNLARQRGLVADPRRQPAEQTRHLRARLHKAKDIIHQQQDILVPLVAKIFGNGQRRQRHAPACARRFVHLAIDEHGALKNAGIAHVEQHLVAFARALANPGKHRDALVPLDHGMDQLHDQHGFANSGAAEHCRLAALRQWRQEVDDLDAGREQLCRTALSCQWRRAAMDRPARHVRGK